MNNADRKDDHILAMPDGHRYGVDHGLTFHVDDKLRMVLWGWLGEDLTPDEWSGVERVRSQLSGQLGETLAGLITGPEIAQLAARYDLLVAEPWFPAPRGGQSAVPWPLF